MLLPVDDPTQVPPRPGLPEAPELLPDEQAEGNGERQRRQQLLETDIGEWRASRFRTAKGCADTFAREPSDQD